MTRQEANRELLKIISEMVELYPNFRFHQILADIDVNKMNDEGTANIDLFAEESEETLKRVKHFLSKYISI